MCNVNTTVRNARDGARAAVVEQMHAEGRVNSIQAAERGLLGMLRGVHDDLHEVNAAHSKCERVERDLSARLAAQQKTNARLQTLITRTHRELKGR
jgi:hypothetical protein